MLKLEGVRSGYGAVRVLRGVDLSVSPGELVALIGANGAGKTTLLRAISGLNPVDQGEIFFSGVQITNAPPEAIVAHGLAHIPQGKQLFRDLTVAQNVKLGAYLRIVSGTQRRARDMDEEEVLTLFPVLRDRLKQKAGTLSGGEQSMLAMARALVSRPRMLLVDEPSLGIAPKIVDRILDTLLLLKKRGIAILLVEQNASAALEIASRAYVLRLGEILATGDSSDLRSDPAVLRAYLGA
ncbi:MAG: ABC transporter ATP-binding protein [Rhizobiaceae bacterium]